MPITAIERGHKLGVSRSLPYNHKSCETSTHLGCRGHTRLRANTAKRC